MDFFLVIVNQFDFSRVVIPVSWQELHFPLRNGRSGHARDLIKVGERLPIVAIEGENCSCTYTCTLYSCFEKGCPKKSQKVYATIPKGSLGHEYLLLTEFEVRTVSYGPSIFPFTYGPSAMRVGFKSTGTYSTDRANEVSKIFIIFLRLIRSVERKLSNLVGCTVKIWPIKLTTHSARSN